MSRSLLQNNQTRRTILFVRDGKPVAFQNTDPELTFADVRTMMGLSKETEIQVEWLPGATGIDPKIQPGKLYGIRKEGNTMVLIDGKDL